LKKELTRSWSITDLKVHYDIRGDLYEVLRFKTQKIPSGGQLYAYTINPGIRRGDHFHLKKSEWLTCVSGSVNLFMKTKKGKLINKILDASSPRLAYIGPGTSHALENVSKEMAVIIAYSSKELDNENPDTYSDTTI
jgi:UDP-2-acetamido-2,6-beta-L-arabino-hexul-4-ose reductase